MGTLGRRPRRNNQSSTLRHRGCLEAQAELSEITDVVSAGGAEAECFVQPASGHASAVVSYPNPRAGAGKRKVDIDRRSSCRQAVVDNVRYRGHKVVAD